MQCKIRGNSIRLIITRKYKFKKIKILFLHGAGKVNKILALDSGVFFVWLEKSIMA